MIMNRDRRVLAEVVQKSYPILMKDLILTIAILSILVISFPGMPEKGAYAATCAPTEEDALGPFYKPNTPVRSSVGMGYVLQGVVRSAKDCAVVPKAVIELWLAGPDGGYDDVHRATVIADASGAYRFESNDPPPYYGRPPHIHLRVSARGFNTLVTQHYPSDGKKSAVFDIVLVPGK
jgi:protocatechuate 3,4-dioxygenase beta subunit